MCGSQARLKSVHSVVAQARRGVHMTGLKRTTRIGRNDYAKNISHRLV